MHGNRVIGIARNVRFLRVFPQVLFLLFVVSIIQSPVDGQSAAGRIEGRVIDKGKDQPLSQQLVILRIHQEGKDVQQRDTKTDNSGGYAFDNLSTAFDVHYVVSTTYDGEEYVEKDIVLSEWVPNIKVNLDIVTFTDDSSQVKIRQHTIFVLPPPADHAPDPAVTVMEMIQAENTSDDMFRTDFDGQSTGLHLNLPKEYEALQIDTGFKQHLTAQTHWLLSNQPLESGESSFGFAYITHIGSQLDLSRSLTFDTDQVFVYIPEGIPLTPQSRALGASRKEHIHGRVFTVYATNPAEPLLTGQMADLRFKFDGSAVQIQGGTGAMNRSPSNPTLIALIAISAALAGGFLVAAIFKMRRPTLNAADDTQKPQGLHDASWLGKLDAADLERTRVARLEIITRLDALYEAREISERVYNRLRKEQVDRLESVLTQINR